MPINFNDFLESAKSSPKKHEISNRNSASRAYYAIYHCCLGALEMEGEFTGGQGGCHEKLIKHLEGSSDPNQKEISYLMNQARKLRVMADYKLGTDFTQSDRHTAIMYAEDIIERLNS